MTIWHIMHPLSAFAGFLFEDMVYKIGLCIIEIFLVGLDMTASSLRDMVFMNG